MQSQSQQPQHVNFSKFASKDAPTVQVPMKVVNRPLPSELDESKVQRFMADIQVRTTLFTLGGSR